MPLKHFSSQAHASTLSPPPAIRIIPTAPNNLTLSHQKNTLQQTASRPHLITTADFELSNIELAEFTDAFSLFDYHGSGHISKKEARIAMRSLGFDTTKQEFDLVMGNVGVKSDESSISLAQFIQVMRYHKAEQQAKLQMASLFQTVLALGGSSRSSSSESLQHTQSTSIRFSNSRMGISAIKNERDIQHILKQKLHASNTDPSKMEINTGITGDHLKRIAALVGEPLSNEDVRDMMEEADKSNCGLVTEQDFIKLMRKTSLCYTKQTCLIKIRMPKMHPVDLEVACPSLEMQF
ncbi:hypothetical protein O5D80_007468 [Batrachochytrium dendrobatidis]|nr:hypothetical protein O5D80_007468 [Batrachochytrium dendrobatidis]